jgi:hypothetical protein
MNGDHSKVESVFIDLVDNRPCATCGHSRAQHTKGVVEDDYCRHCPCTGFIAATPCSCRTTEAGRPICEEQRGFPGSYCRWEHQCEEESVMAEHAPTASDFLP